jgi:hypothetical protein
LGEGLHGQEERQALRDRPELTIIAFQPQRSIATPFDIDVVITNLTVKDLEIRRVTILLPEAIRATRRDTLPETLEAQVQPLAPGSDRIYRLGVPTMRRSVFEILTDFRTLIFLPGTYVIRAVVEYTETGEAGRQSLSTTYELPLEPPLSSVISGGVLGALLLALFIPVYRVLNAVVRARPAPKRPVIQGLVFLAAGSIVSTTAILLLQRLGDLNLPITVDVNDYLGGIVVGLFSYKIGDVLYSQFFETARSSP